MDSRRPTRYECFQRTTLFIVFVVGLATVLFGLNRLGFLLSYGSAFLDRRYASELLLAFGTGVLFDVKVLVIGLAPLFLAGVIASVLPGRLASAVVDRAAVPFAVVVLSLYSFILVVDHYYWAYFQSHINVLVFGLFEDDTWATLSGVWDDYPVVPALIAIAVFALALRFGLRRLHDRCRSIPALRGTAPRSLFVALSTVLLFVGGRGSLGRQPLEVESIDLSKEPFVNQLSFNGVLALKEAIWERCEFHLDTDPDQALAKFGYDDAARALGDYVGLPAARFPDEEQVVDGLFGTTPRNETLERHPPHVVVVVMESFGLDALEFHDRDTDLLGRLAPHFESDLVFRHFLSSREGTISSLDAILVGSPLSPLGQSVYRYAEFPSSAVLPFRRAGYETDFLTSGSASWRKLNEFMPRLGFDRVLGRGAIHGAIEGAEDNAWGVFDEYLYDYALQVLGEADAAGKPAFLFLLTTSTHSPYMLPPDYQPNPIALSGDLVRRLIVSPERAEVMLASYQYANDAFGSFLDRLKSGPLASRVVVAATGDHTLRGMFDFGTRGEQLLAHGVPLYLYVPPRYMENAEPRTARFGFHGDIFPTLYHRSLSGARYFRSGRDLLSAGDEDPPGFALHDFQWALDGHGAVRLGDPAQYYAWDGDRLTPTDPAADDPSRSLEKRSRGYAAVMNWYIRECLTGGGGVPF